MTEAMEKKRFVIGIDPGETVGVAVWDRDERKFYETFSGDFWEAWDVVTGFSPDLASVVVENPNLNKPTFFHGGVTRAEMRKREAISRRVGKNQRDADLWIDGLRRLGYEVVEVRPRSAKWDRETCRRATGYDRRPNNQHVRDAIKMVYQL